MKNLFFFSTQLLTPIVPASNLTELPTKLNSGVFSSIRAQGHKLGAEVEAYQLHGTTSGALPGAHRVAAGLTPRCTTEA